MARKKVKLAWILNDSTRRVACRKRTKGLLKKVSELSTLCGVEVAVVAINPSNPEPDIWPSVPDAIRTLEKFKSLPDGKSLDDLNSQELSDLAGMIDAKVNALEERFNDLKGKETHSVQQASVEEGIGSTNDSCRMVPMMEFLKEQTCFMETMDTDEHVGPSNGAGAVKLFDADDLVDEFSGDF
ncbi:agamous-like MADS-box protein AGL90 [Aristolochia californica]|uniref:agamous-like MADS-box protein AGL90 n=1 Tax=Aristolochia californica TaxID=171875 RepID=UPI0035D58316